MESNESTKVTCPKCGSENINYQAVPVLSRKKGKGFFWWLLIGWWWGIIELIFWIFATLPMLIANLIIREDKITRVDFYAVCQNCGNGWKVKHKTNKKANLIRFFITMGFILLFLLIVIPSNQDGGGQRSEDPNTIYTQAAEAMFAGMTQTAAVNPDAIYTQVAATLYAQASKPTEMPIAEPTQTPLQKLERAQTRCLLANLWT